MSKNEEVRLSSLYTARRAFKGKVYAVPSGLSHCGPFGALGGKAVCYANNLIYHSKMIERIYTIQQVQILRCMYEHV